MSLFQSNLRKQIRNLPKILNFVKKTHYYSKLFTSLLDQHAGPLADGRKAEVRVVRADADEAALKLREDVAGIEEAITDAYLKVRTPVNNFE